MNFGLWRAALFGAALAVASLARAQSVESANGSANGPTADKPIVAPFGGTPGVQPTTLRWHDTSLYWDHAVGTSSLGVGQSYQSRNPVYEMTIGLRPRYYFVENEHTTLSARADLGLITERTNSDTTTQQGEWSATDFELWGAYTHVLREGHGDLTEFFARVPRITLPTSKVSYDSGKLLDVGARVGIREDVVLAGRSASFFPNIELAVKAQYGYQFTSSRVLTNGALERIRLDPEGRSVVSDQLSGATEAAHSAVFGAAALTHVHQRVLWTTAFELRPAWKYAVAHDTRVCGVVLTGCTQAGGVADPTTRSPLTYFQTELWFTLTDTLGLLVGYLNLSQQLAPDGRRRDVLYSPDARFYATLDVSLDHLYVGLSPRGQQSASAGSEPHSP